MINTADVIAEVLKSEGIDRIFGIPGGGSTTDLMVAANKRGIETVLSCHEASSALIASVYGEIKRKPGVCFSIMGPGATNLASGIAYAHLERSPLLAITERHDSKNYEFISTQKIDHKKFFAPITKHHFVLSANNVQEISERAIHIAKEERPGPVHLDLPKDEAAKEASYEIRNKEDPVRLSGLIPEDLNAFHAIVEKIEHAVFPVIIAGIGAKRGGAHSALAALAEKLNVPVMVSLKGKGVFDEGHKLYGGAFLGTYAKGTFEDAVVGKSDLLLIIGVDPVELLPKPWGLDRPVIHIGFESNPDGYYPPELEIVGDIKTILEILARHSFRRKRRIR